MICNLCGSNEFIDMNSRKNVRCKKCDSLERTRLLWLYIQRYKITHKTKILHLAPEKGIYDQLSKIIPNSKYVVADLDPKRYKFAKNCQKIDLCNLDDQKSNQFDFIIHSHVMEHIPCNVAYTLFHLHRMLKKRGRHMCIIPFMNGSYDESYNEKLTDEERTKRFGQFDHVRRFGKEDVHKHVGSIIKIPASFDATLHFSPDVLKSYNIPENHWKGLGIGTVLDLSKKDYLLT